VKSLLSVVLYLFTAASASAQVVMTPRPLDPIVAEAFASAQAQSAVVRSPVATLESSNVNVVEELVNMIETQRAYEMNSKAISATDQMLQYMTSHS